MIFAGHPTIGTSFVLLDENQVSTRSNSFFLEEKVGKIQIWVEQGESPMIWLRTPPISEGRVFDRSLCAQALNLQTGDLLDVRPQLLDAGNPTLFVALKDKEAVDQAWLDPQGMMSLKDGEDEPFCVFVFAQTEEGAYSRMFAPDYGVAEDPATGSSTGPLAAFMMKHDLLPKDSSVRFISEQGTKMLRRSLLHVKLGDDTDPGGIYIGGHVTPIAEGTMKL